MNTISVITAVHAASAQYLGDAYASLMQQELPQGWTWEWCVQEDGADVGAAAQLPTDDPRILISSGRRGGPHVARNLALSRASGAYIRTLDSDDQLTAGALAREIDVLTSHPEVGWTTAAVLDLLEDGTYSTFTLGNPDPGILPQQSMYHYWVQRHRPQVHPASLCARRHLVSLLGGWMAIPSSEDTGLLLALDAISPGWYIAEPGLIYRKHPGQMTNDPSHSSGKEWEHRMSLIRERAEALHAWGRPDPHQLVPSPSARTGAPAGVSIHEE